MFILNEEEVVKQSTINNYTKGKDLYNHNFMNFDDIISSKQKTDSQITLYKINFQDKQGMHEASIRIHDTYGILYYDCDCNDFEGFYKGMCPHIVCLALTIMNNNKKQEPSNKIAEGVKKVDVMVVEQKKTEIAKDKLIFDSIINQYEDQEGNHVSNIHIEPQINIYTNELSLKLGEDYLYIVSDIKELLTAINNKLTIQYGKKLAFVHETSAFDEESQKLIFLLNKIIYLGNDQFHSINLTPYAYEEIFEIYKETTININGLNTYITNEDYDLKIKLTNKNNLELSVSSFQVIPGFTKNYIYVNKRIYSLNTFDKALHPLFSYLKKHRRFNLDNTMDEFINSLYPIIYDKIDIYPEFEEKYPIQKLIIDTYFDFENGVIEAKPQYEMLNKSLEHAIYDKKKERAYYEEIKTLGFYPKNDKLIIDQAEGITKFLGSNLEHLKEYGAVFVSDTLDKININQIMPQINVSYNVDMLSVCFEDLNYTEEELYQIYKAYTKQKRYVILNNNTITKINDDFHEIYHVIKDFNLDPKKLKTNQDVPLYLAMKNANSNFIKYGKEIRQMFDEIKNYQKTEPKIPSTIKADLRQYQKEGFNWLKTLSKYKFGGILADDMGLGKTLQIITLLANDESNKPSLIVCPTSLTYNWKNEIDKWDTSLNKVIISGSANYRYQKINSIQDDKTIYITSYDSLRRDVDFYHNEFRYIILDEAQYIKNYFTQKAQAVKSLKSDLKFALTGTPIENSLLDLWSIFDFLMPEYLGGFNDFKTKYATALEDESLSKLAKKIQPFVLRRTKSEVLKELPDKIEIIHVAQMASEQRKVYESFLLKAREAITTSDNKISILAMLTRLRQLCVDPRLYLENYLGGSCKVDLCLNIIEEAITENHRILLFSQFKSLFPIIEKRLRDKNIIYLEITGDTKSQDRIDLVDKFNENNEIKVFLISLKAGGTGLNLTGADTVIHFDPWWNVSAENQASDRAHRIGQTRVVSVNKLICEDSIEQKVLELQNLKKELTEKIISDEQSISKLTDSDLNFLLS